MVQHINFIRFKEYQILTQNPKVFAFDFYKKNTRSRLKLTETSYFLAVHLILCIGSKLWSST
jgi:hypothetical protein